MENWTKPGATNRPPRAWSIAGDDLLDHALEQLGVHRLFQESRCAGGVRLRLDLSVRQRRDDDDRYLTRRRQLLEELHTPPAGIMRSSRTSWGFSRLTAMNPCTGSSALMTW